MDKKTRKMLGSMTLEILTQHKYRTKEIADLLDKSEEELHEIYNCYSEDFFTVEELEKLEEHTELPISIFLLNDLLKEESKLSKNERKLYKAAREVLKITREIHLDHKKEKEDERKT